MVTLYRQRVSVYILVHYMHNIDTCSFKYCRMCMDSLNPSINLSVRFSYVTKKCIAFAVLKVNN